MLLDNRYELNPQTDLIGQGGFAKVYKATDTKFGMTVAIKHFSNQNGSKGSVIKEIKKSIHFSHPNIIRYFDCFETQHTNSMGETITEEYGVMEYASAGSLSDIISGKVKVNAEHFKDIILGILDGLHYLHTLPTPIIHRDLKPSNILLQEQGGKLIPKICDFGISKEWQDATTTGTMTGMVGTMEYMSPEQIAGKGIQPNTDLWALGCIIFEYFTGQPPFGKVSSGTSIPALNNNILNATFSTAEFNKIPEPFRALVKACLVKDAGKRVVSAEMGKTILLAKNGGETPPPPLNWKLLAGIVSILVFVLIAYLAIQSNSGNTKGTENQSEEAASVLEETAPKVEMAESVAEPVKATVNEEVPVEMPPPPPSKPSTTSLSTLPAPIQKLMNDMVYIQGGTFTMGCTWEQGSDCESDEKPVHDVTLSSYSIGKYEITQVQWVAVMGSNPSEFKGCDNCPVEFVSWEDVQDFIRKLNQLTGQSFRLPTEAEWEFAARGGNKSQNFKYSGSDDLGSVAWYSYNGNSKTHPVGQKRSNELGLFDMSGNVWEWCKDWYSAYSSSSKTNPCGPSTGAYRVFRGGSWINGAQYCRVSFRDNSTHTYSHKALGFRLAHD